MEYRFHGSIFGDLLIIDGYCTDGYCIARAYFFLKLEVLEH